MSQPKSIGKILPKVIKKLGLTQKVKEIELSRDWNEIVGKTIAKHCRPVNLNKGSLAIAVDSSPWLSELERYSKETMLGKIQERFGKRMVNQIKFRIGTIK